MIGVGEMDRAHAAALAWVGCCVPKRDCTANCVRLSIGRSPRSYREMVDCCTPRRSAISICVNPS